MKKETGKPTQAVGALPEDAVSSPSSKHEDADNSEFVQVQHPPHIILGSELVSRDISDIRMLYDGLILAGGNWAIVGASDTCKSMLLRNLGLCVAGGKEFLGRPFRGKYRSVVIVSSEDDEESIAVLLKKQNKTLQLSVEELSRIRFIFDTTDLLPKVEQELERRPADLVIIDAFGDVFDGKDINQNNQVRAFLNTFGNVAKKHGCSLCFLHHTGKRTEELIPSKNNSIGSQGFEAKMRMVVELRVDASDAALRHFCIVKGNYLPGDAKNASYVLKMDENLTFTDTSRRVSFDDLAVKKEKSSSDQKKSKPYDFEDEEHEAFLQETFRLKGATFSSRRLTERVCSRFGVGDKNARLFVEFYIERKWLLDKSTSHNRRELHINTFGMKPMI